MTSARLRQLLVVISLAGCSADVVLGINFPADAGLADSGVSIDGGFVDAGEVDSGSADASVVDAGAPDSGMIDAGEVDSGVADSGAVDAGDVDAGFDGGTDAGIDAGPPDLSLEFSGAVAVESGDLTVLTVHARNIGGRVARDAGVIVTIPLGLSFSSSTDCTPATPQAIGCALGDVVSGGVATADFTLTADAGLGWRSLRGQVLSEDDSADANDVLDYPMAVTNVGTLVLPIVAPRLARLDACFGTNIMSYSQCTPGSLLSGYIFLYPDGGAEPADGGYSGAWGQAAHQRNVGFRFFVGPMTGRQYTGASVIPNCFDGVSDIGTVFYAGAFRLCLM